MQECLSPEVPNRPDFGHLPLTNFKDREMSGGETKKGLILVRPTLGRQYTRISKPVSKVLQIFLGLDKKNVEERSVRTCRWAVKVRSVMVLEPVM